MRLGWLLMLGLAPALCAQAPVSGFRVGVVSESGDIITWLKPDGARLTPDRVVPIGVMPADIDGPHNITISPDNRFELFPTTISLTPDGALAFVANSDFHGDHPRTNVVTVVHAASMTPITNMSACDMPHGVKVNHAGNRVYISCMHSDELLEIDVSTLQITRRAPTGTGHQCAPTFVSVSPDDRTLFVACNYGNSLQVWDATTFTYLREIPVGTGAYNVEPCRDGSLVVVTNKKAQSVSLVDIRTNTEVARIPTSKKIVHGVAFSPDGKYAYISSESIGADPGSVDVVDLAARKVVFSIPVPGQPTGITIWQR